MSVSTTCSKRSRAASLTAHRTYLAQHGCTGSTPRSPRPASGPSRLLFPGEKKTPHHLLMVGLFTGTVGILLADRLPARGLGHAGNMVAGQGGDPHSLLPRQVHRLVVRLGRRSRLEPAAQLRRLHLRRRALRGALQGPAASELLPTRRHDGLAERGGLGAGFRNRVRGRRGYHVFVALLQRHRLARRLHRAVRLVRRPARYLDGLRRHHHLCRQESHPGRSRLAELQRGRPSNRGRAHGAARALRHAAQERPRALGPRRRRGVVRLVRPAGRNGPGHRSGKRGRQGTAWS